MVAQMAVMGMLFKLLHTLVTGTILVVLAASMAAEKDQVIKEQEEPQQRFMAAEVAGVD